MTPAPHLCAIGCCTHSIARQMAAACAADGRLCQRGNLGCLALVRRADVRPETAHFSHPCETSSTHISLPHILVHCAHCHPASTVSG